MSSSLSFENIDALESPSHQSSHSQSTTPVPTPTQNTYAAAGSRGVDEESKFAPLFNPSTPKASPTMTPVPDAVMDAQIKSGFSEPIHIKSHSRRSGSVSSQSDFGSFVSVAEFDDPLSADFGSFEEQQLPNPLESASKQSAAPASKTFFDAVTKDATKSAAERRSLILDELLEHEDDPMYFLKDLKFGGSAKPEPDINKSLPPAMSPTSPAPNPPPKSPSAWKIHSPPLPPHQSPPVDVEDGLDHHYFASPQSNIVDPKQPLSRRSSNLARTASLPLTTPPSLAPPISSPNVVAQSSTSYLNVDPLDLNKTDTNPQANLSSYQSLSNIPTKWMSSLLRPSSIPSQGAKPSLESIFNDHLSNSGSPSSSPSSTHSSLQDSRRRGSSNSPTRAKTLPQPIQPNITHGTPFAPATITHSNSPFASHVYIPPSGAPGFKGEGYDWDKGFSTQLEHERLAHQNQLSQNAKPLPPITQSPPPWDRDNDSHDDLTSHQDRKWSSETTASKGGWANTFGSFGFGSLRGTKPAVSRSIGPEGFAGEPGQRQPHSVYTERGRSRDRPSVPDAGE
ncbi:hypothetical protein BJ165DRAFT_343057 [Panaeolus papilionaceus]|nr:hypothetical protein BJ165DRAFT_343057 [Panaeolus papilionaceus]